jgi:opacity protein-like surface antigen
MSRPSINKSVVLAAALVLSFGAAGEAGAQRRIPIRKDAPPPRDTVFVPAATPEARRDTVWIIRQDTINTSRVDTVVMIRDMSRSLRGGGYLGVYGGASLPMRDWADFVDTGWDLGGTLGYQAPRSPWGVRLDVQYDRWLGENGDTGGADVCGTTGDTRCESSSAWSGLLDGTLTFPVGGGMLNKWRPEIYILGGFNVDHIKANFGGGTNSTATTGELSQSKTVWGVNGGGGVAIGIGRGADMFIETRWIHTLKSGDDQSSDFFPATDFLPINLGFRFGAPFMRR